MIYNLFQRGIGLFKLLFVIDDFFRAIIVTILLPVLFHWLGFGKTIVLVGLGVGALMDFYDFVTEFGPGKTLSKKDFNLAYIFRKRHGFFRFVFAVHDLLEICSMTILIPIFLSWLGIGFPIITIGVAFGMAIDAHDFLTEFGEGKIQFEE